LNGQLQDATEDWRDSGRGKWLCADDSSDRRVADENKAAASQNHGDHEIYQITHGFVPFFANWVSQLPFD
jgi:hypothetical protein